MATDGGPNTVTNGLVLHLDAGNFKSYPGSGTTWFDKSGNSNNGTLINGPTFNSSNGGSMVFDGVNDYITTPNVIGGFTNYSAEFWFKLNTNTAGVEKWLGSQYSSAGGGVGRVIFMIFTSNKIRNFINGTSFDGDTTILTNIWYHVVFTRNTTGSGTIYLNGVLDGSGTLSTPAVQNQPYINGGTTSFSNRWVNGQIPITRLYNKALSAQEVLQNYNATKSRFNL
jgi:hypothetical protein